MAARLCYVVFPTGQSYSFFSVCQGSFGNQVDNVTSETVYSQKPAIPEEAHARVDVRRYGEVDEQARPAVPAGRMP